MKVYAIWNVTKKGFVSANHGCQGGINIITFNTREAAQQWAVKYERTPYVIKGISVA